VLEIYQLLLHTVVITYISDIQTDEMFIDYKARDAHAIEKYCNYHYKI